jgi:Domain of unknown function (DUF4184)
MPFTFSHPAAVLPLAYLPKRFISMTGLVIGSMAPDFEYFLKMKSYSSYSHTWPGLFWFDLPVSIMLAFAFHLFVRDRLIDNLPVFLTKRLLIFKNFNWVKHFKENFLIVIVSIIVGVTSHILWDKFTHEGKIFVQIIDEAHYTFTIAGHSFSRYRILQDVSSIIGGLIVIYALFELPAGKLFVRQRSIVPFWLSVTLITLVIVSIWILLVDENRFFKNLIIVTISGGLIGLVVTSAILPQELYPENSE